MHGKLNTHVRLSQSAQQSDQENQMASLMDEINAVQPDSQVRVDAIRDAEEERQTQLANRTNPLDDELIKTKGLLRCPSLRSTKGERRKQKREKEDTSGGSTTEREATGTPANLNLALSSPSCSQAKSTNGPLTSVCLKGTTVNGGDMEISVFEKPGDRVVDVILPSPSSSWNSSCTVAEAELVQASYVILPSIENSSFSPKSDINCDKGEVLPGLDKTATCHNNQNENIYTSETSTIKANVGDNATDIGSYVSLTADAKLTDMLKSDKDSNFARQITDQTEKPSPTLQQWEPSSESGRSSGHRNSAAAKKNVSASSFKAESAGADAAAIKELMKDVENFNRKENLTSPKKKVNNHGDS
ncbi:RING finger protein 207-like [Plakobranchus ocellatus]|uniref:RING finger protein 207-like n=1 Tax=Plakobranchus ocellatus TaxID=259542 RepID=A0AAV3Y469_9GAST|nr:RING finger protein 207-like [Plakobranchus ocellatus]